MRAVIGLISGVMIGAFLGFVAEPWFAVIALKTRPVLTDLNFWEAMFSGHFMAWLFACHLKLMSILTTIAVGVVGMLWGIASKEA